MTEQSSTVVAFRALVMLICLVLIPVAAFCGGSFPAVIKAIQNGRWPTLADFRGPAGPLSSEPTEAPRFVSPQVPGGTQTAPRTSVFSGPSIAYEGSKTTDSQVIAANYMSPVAPSSTREAGQSTVFPQNKDLASDSNRGLSPVPPGAGNLLPLGSPTTPARDGDQGSAAANATPNDQFKHVLDRLKQLGATYFVLEPCGDQQGEFRFYCRMSIGGNQRDTKPFYCFNCDPLKAMSDVLKQVEAWQTRGYSER